MIFVVVDVEVEEDKFKPVWFVLLNDFVNFNSFVCWKEVRIVANDGIDDLFILLVDDDADESKLFALLLLEVIIVEFVSCVDVLSELNFIFEISQLAADLFVVVVAVEAAVETVDTWSGLLFIKLLTAVWVLVSLIWFLLLLSSDVVVVVVVVNEEDWELVVVVVLVGIVNFEGGFNFDNLFFWSEK